MAKGDDIQDRLVNFAVEIIKQSSQLPDTPAGRHIANQLLRCGTSPAPNYGEARGAESKNDFVHKLKVVLKELNESNVWLEILRRSELVSVSSIEQPILSVLNCARLSTRAFRQLNEMEVPDNNNCQLTIVNSQVIIEKAFLPL